MSCFGNAIPKVIRGYELPRESIRKAIRGYELPRIAFRMASVGNEDPRIAFPKAIRGFIHLHAVCCYRSADDTRLSRPGLVTVSAKAVALGGVGPRHARRP